MMLRLPADCVKGRICCLLSGTMMLMIDNEDDRGCKWEVAIVLNLATALEQGRSSQT
jgi:hypothetical protein